MKLLECSNPRCSSVQSPQTPLFSVNLTVEPDGSLAEDPTAIEGGFFECTECHADGKWVAPGCMDPDPDETPTDAYERHGRPEDR